MNQHLSALEAFVKEDGSWHEWLSFLTRPELPLLATLRHAARNGDEPGLRRSAELMNSDEFPDRLFNAFATHAEFGHKQIHTGFDKGSGIDLHRLHSLLLAAVAAARVAAQFQTNGIAHTITAVGNILGGPRDEGAPDPELVEAALRHLGRAGCGPAALVSWVCDFLRIEAETIDRVPLACVIDGCRGGLAYLSLHSWLCIPEIAHGLTPDLETALRPIDNDLLVSLREVEPAPITRLISWGIACPAGLRANHLGGNSLQGAASVALGLINRGERFDRGVLILTTNRDGLLRPVGHEHLKLLAAVESYDHGRTSGYARDDQSSLRKIILSEDSDCDMSPADARGMPWLRLKTVHEAAEAVAAANLSTEAKVYQIAHATRRVKAMAPPPGGESVVETATGEVRFGPDNRTEFVSEVEFRDNNKLRDPYTLHYRAQAAGSLVEADCHPSEDNLFFDEIGYVNYQQFKKFYEFKFIPSPGAKYQLTAQVFGGFGAGCRNMHCHFLDRAVYDLVVFELDLRAFDAAESRFRVCSEPDDGPRLRLWRELPPEFETEASGHQPERHKADRRRGGNVCDRFCAMARTSTPLAPAVAADGFWRWEIEKVRFGAVLWVDWEGCVLERVDEFRGEH